MLLSLEPPEAGQAVVAVVAVDNKTASTKAAHKHLIVAIFIFLLTSGASPRIIAIKTHTAAYVLCKDTHSSFKKLGGLVRSSSFLSKLRNYLVWS